MGRTIAGVVAGFALGFGCALLTGTGGSAERPLNTEELADQQDMAQKRVDRAERQMQREGQKRHVPDRDSQE